MLQVNINNKTIFNEKIKCQSLSFQLNIRICKPMKSAEDGAIARFSEIGAPSTLKTI